MVSERCERHCRGPVCEQKSNKTSFAACVCPLHGYACQSAFGDGKLERKGSGTMDAFLCCLIRTNGNLRYSEATFNKEAVTVTESKSFETLDVYPIILGLLRPRANWEGKQLFMSNYVAIMLRSHTVQALKALHTTLYRYTLCDGC